MNDLYILKNNRVIVSKIMAIRKKTTKKFNADDPHSSITKVIAAPTSSGESLTVANHLLTFSVILINFCRLLRYHLF